MLKNVNRSMKITKRKKDYNMTEVKYHDDFEWQSQYPIAHHAQTHDIETNGDFLFELPRHSSIENGKVKIPSYYTKDLHINHRFLFETIIEKNPETVFEVGCGYGNNLVGIKRLLPEIKLFGCDISDKQLYVATQRYYECKEFGLMLGDFLELNIPKDSFDLVFSQAVLMHMSTNRAMKALEKMVDISNKWIVSTDGGLVIPNIREFLASLGKVTFFDDIAEKYWTDYFVPPFIIEKGP